MLPSLLTVRSLLSEHVAALRESVHSTPDIRQTLIALKEQLANLCARLVTAMQLTSFSSVYKFVSRWFVKLAKLCIEALDWLLLPRLAWKITVRHCIALLVLFFLKVFWRVAILPICRALYNFCRPFFVSGDYLQQEGLLQDRMESARQYPDWKKAANELDRLQGRYHWKESPISMHYDWRRIRDDLKRFRELVDAQDARGIMSFSRSRLLRNLVGINDRRLYTHLRAGTKRLIEEYISEVVRALQLVCVVEQPTSSTTTAEDGTLLENDQPVTTAEKLSFFNETRHAFGRSALLLSGGATLGLYHIGVCKSLHENSLLPRVLSGSSVGSIICAMVGTRTDEELTDLFSPESNVIKLNFFPPNGGSARRKLTRLFTQGVLMDIRILKKCVKANVPPLTFQEAYELSGRIINIVVSPASGAGNKDSLRLLNYLTAPNVLVWSAALASCAIPGIYAPVELLKKDEKTGKLSPYMEGGAPIKWEDGSVQADLPMQRLSELFNINHFIVSQVNPHVIPFISSESSTHTFQQSFLSAPVTKLIDYLTSQLKSTALNFLHLNMMPIHPSVKYILDQKYLGDVTIVPNVKPLDYTQLLVNPTSDRLRDCVHVSEQSTWKLLPTIRGACEIEFALDECVRRMRGTLILEELHEARNINRQMSRVRSWSSDLLAVGRQIAPSTSLESNIDDSDDMAEGRDECLLQPNGTVSMRARSVHNLNQPLMSRAKTDKAGLTYARELKRWNTKFQPPIPRATTVANMIPSNPRHLYRVRNHEPEEDDNVSEEEEYERRKYVGAVQSQSNSNLGLPEGEGEGDQMYIDDEGIPRKKPMLTPIQSAEENLTPPNVYLNQTLAQPPAPTPTSTINPSALPNVPSAIEPSQLNNGMEGLSLNRQSDAVKSSPSPPSPPFAVPAPSNISSISPSLPPSLPFSPPSVLSGEDTVPDMDSNHFKPPTRSPSQSIASFSSTRPIRSALPRRKSSNNDDRIAPMPSAASSSSSATIKPYSHSRPRTPTDPLTSPLDDVKLSESEWLEEKNSARLAQLLKTSQTKVSMNAASKRNARPTKKTKGDVSLHIPSLVNFRHTPPRRMSAMDLAQLDQITNDESPIDRKFSSLRTGTKPRTHLTDSENDDDQDDEQRAQLTANGDGGDASSSGTIGKWLTRASSFFRRDSESGMPLGGRSQSSTPAGQTPLEVSEDDHDQDEDEDHTQHSSNNSSPQRNNTFAPRSATHHHLTYLVTQSPERTSSTLQQRHALKTSVQPISSNVTGPTITSTGSSPSQSGTSSPRMNASRLNRQHVKSNRFRAPHDIEGEESASPTILRAASSGLPRTLSSLELISDVTTMP